MKKKVMAVASIGGHWILKNTIFSGKQKKKSFSAGYKNIFAIFAANL